MKLVYIEWHDAHGVEPNWEWMEELLEKVDFICITKSVGWLIKQNWKQVVVLPHYIEASKDTRAQGCGEMTIPKVNIVRRVDLGVPKATRTPPGRGLAAPRRRLTAKRRAWDRLTKTLPGIVEAMKPKPQGSV